MGSTRQHRPRRHLRRRPDRAGRSSRSGFVRARTPRGISGYARRSHRRRGTHRPPERAGAGSRDRGAARARGLVGDGNPRGRRRRRRLALTVGHGPCRVVADGGPAHRKGVHRQPARGGGYRPARRSRRLSACEYSRSPASRGGEEPPRAVLRVSRDMAQRIRPGMQASVEFELPDGATHQVQGEVALVTAKPLPVWLAACCPLRRNPAIGSMSSSRSRRTSPCRTAPLVVFVSNLAATRRPRYWPSDRRECSGAA